MANDGEAGAGTGHGASFRQGEWADGGGRAGCGVVAVTRGRQQTQAVCAAMGGQGGAKGQETAAISWGRRKGREPCGARPAGNPASATGMTQRVTGSSPWRAYRPAGG